MVIVDATCILTTRFMIRNGMCKIIARTCCFNGKDVAHTVRVRCPSMQPNSLFASSCSLRIGDNPSAWHDSTENFECLLLGISSSSSCTFESPPLFVHLVVLSVHESYRQIRHCTSNAQFTRRSVCKQMHLQNGNMI